MCQDKKKAVVYTTGCRTNQAESDIIKQQLLRAGFDIVGDGPADLYVINACTLTAKADRKARNLVYRARRLNPQAKVVLAGCLATRLEFEKNNVFFKDVAPDLMLNNKEKLNVVEKLNDLFKISNYSGAQVDTEGFELSRKRRTLKVQDGCPRNCSYCIVPYVRGKSSRSISFDEAIEAARRMEQLGALEIVLTGIHVGLYGRDLRPRRSLSELMKGILDATEHVMLRLSSIEPEEVKDDLIEVFASKRVCGHVHLPLQSGSDRVLRGMHRPYTAADYVRLVEKIRKVRPEVAVGMDVIVGYPEEDEAAFLETVETIKRVRPAYMHVFRYSPRPNTPAYTLGDPVNFNEKHKRATILGRMSAEYRQSFAKGLIGKRVRVIPVKPNSDWLEGLTDTYMKVLYRGSMDRVEDVLIVDFKDGFLIGED